MTTTLVVVTVLSRRLAAVAQPGGVRLAGTSVNACRNPLLNRVQHRLSLIQPWRKSCPMAADGAGGHTPGGTWR